MYTAEFEAVTVRAATAVDFFQLAPVDDKPIEVVGLFLAQSSDVGDAQEELLRYRVIRGHNVSGSGGATPTPRQVNRSDAAVGTTAQTCNTTIASSGSPVNLHSDVFNIRAGLPLWLPEGCGWHAGQGDGTLVVRLMAGPADDLTMSGTIYFRELG
jgi:hypothetical protein